MSAVTLDTAELAGLSLEFLLYGVFVVLFIQSQNLLLFSPRSATSVRSTGKVVLVTASILLFLFTSAHFAIDVSRLFDAFIYNRDHPGGPALYLGTLANPKNVAKTACYLVQTVIGDLIMVYRVYMVYQKNIWVVSFPLLMIGGIICTGIGITIKFSQFNIGVEIFESDTGHWILSWFIVTLMSTFTSTCLIAFRIWSMDRRMKSAMARSSLSPIIHIIVESAACYSAVLAFTLFSYVGKSNIQFIGIDATSPTIGIVFTVIIVRLYDGGQKDSTSRSAVTAEGPLPLHSLNVTVNTTTRVDTDDSPLSAREAKIRAEHERPKSYASGRPHSLTWSSNDEEV